MTATNPLEQATTQHHTTANELLAGVLSTSVDVAARVLDVVKPEAWPNGHYRLIAEAIRNHCDTAAGSTVQPLEINTDLQNNGALKNGDLKQLWNNLVAPGIGDPFLLEVQLVQRVRMLEELRYRIVFHDVFRDDDGAAFVWSVDELNGAINARLDMLRAAYPAARVLEVPHAA